MLTVVKPFKMPFMTSSVSVMFRSETGALKVCSGAQLLPAV